MKKAVPVDGALAQRNLGAPGARRLGRPGVLEVHLLPRGGAAWRARPAGRPCRRGSGWRGRSSRPGSGGPRRRGRRSSVSAVLLAGLQEQVGGRVRRRGRRPRRCAAVSGWRARSSASCGRKPACRLTEGSPSPAARSATRAAVARLWGPVGVGHQAAGDADRLQRRVVLAAGLHHARDDLDAGVAEGGRRVRPTRGRSRRRPGGAGPGADPDPAHPLDEVPRGIRAWRLQLQIASGMEVL